MQELLPAENVRQLLYREGLITNSTLILNEKVIFSRTVNPKRGRKFKTQKIYGGPGCSQMRKSTSGCTVVLPGYALMSLQVWGPVSR